MTGEFYENDEVVRQLAVPEILDCDLTDLRPLAEISNGNQVVFSERTAIAEDVAVSLVRYRARMLGAAALADVSVSETDRQNWYPNDAELTELRKVNRTSRIRLAMLEGMRTYIEDGRHRNRLYPHQALTVLRTRDFLESAPRMPGKLGKNGYVDKPTGTGKTATFIETVAAVKSYEDPDDPVRVLVLTPTVPILNQTIGKPEKQGSKRTKPNGFAKFAPKLDVGAYHGGTKELDKDVVVMTNASFNMLVKQGKMPHFDLVIVDEVHTDLGENISESMQEYYEDKVVIGYSATPDYHDTKRTGDLLQHRIDSMDLAIAVKAGELAPVSAELRRLDLIFDTNQLPDDPKERQIAIKKAYLLARLNSAMEDIKATITAGYGVALRCPAGGNIAYAELAAEVVRRQLVSVDDGSGKLVRPIRAVAVGGRHQERSYQDYVIGSFNERDVDAMSYVNLINLGTDIPVAKLLVNLAPTGSRVNMVQAIGRVMRLVRDERGRPVPAKVIDFIEPNMPLGVQYTALDALRLRKGVSQFEYQTPNLPQFDDDEWRPEDVAKVQEAAIRSIDVHEVGNMVLKADGSTVQYVTNGATKFEQTVDLQHEKFTPRAACNYVGVSLKKLKDLLAEIGVEDVDEAGIRQADVMSVLVAHPELQVDELPPEGYVSVQEAADHLRVKQTASQWAREVRRLGITIYRFRKDGVVGQYLSESVL